VKRPSSQSFDAFCREAVDFLSQASVPYLIIGGLAVATVGQPRATGDVDVIAYVPMDKAIALIDAAVPAGFEVAPDERDKLKATGTLRFRRGRFSSTSSSLRCRSRTKPGRGRTSTGCSAGSCRCRPPRI
jgi:hypothetical protein